MKTSLFLHLMWYFLKTRRVSPFDCRTSPCLLHHYTQACTSTRSTSIPPGVLSFQVEFVKTFNLTEDIFLLLFWLVSAGLALISGIYV